MELREKPDPNHPIPEEHIVAFGALNEVYGPQWRQLAMGACTDAAQKAVDEAVQRCRKTGAPARWPPSDAELDSFERSLQGIRVPSG